MLVNKKNLYVFQGILEQRKKSDNKIIVEFEELNYTRYKAICKILNIEIKE
jgi:hypothetical protein